MVAGLAIRDPSGQPHLARSRSHTTPSSSAAPQQIEEVAAATTLRSPPRPSHGRSHSSVSTKPQKATTLPADPPQKHSHTLRLPGTHREHKHHLRHRHTQSEAKHNSKHESTDSLPHLVSRLQKEKVVAEKQQHANLSRQGTNTSTSTWHSHVNNLVRIASTDPYRNMPGLANDSTPAFGAAYHRAWDGASGPRTGLSTRQPTTRTQTWIELAIDRASAKKELELLAPKPLDVERRQAELQTAQEELRARLADVGRQSGELGRRLEYTYYSLLEKLASLVGTIHSFQSLSEQSRQLMRNFEEKTGEMDGEVKKKVGAIRANLERAEETVVGFEGRCERAVKKARELQTRLENVRTMVENWDEREEQATRTWWMVWGMVFWGTLALCLLVGGVVMYKGALLGGRDPISAGLGMSPVEVDTRPGNHSLAMDIPEEVRVVLEGIEERRRGASPPLQEQAEIEVGDRRVERARDARLRVLDEL
jgi:hypothetical protein